MRPHCHGTVVGAEETEDDGEPFEQKEKRLTAGWKSGLPNPPNSKSGFLLIWRHYSHEQGTIHRASGRGS
jgi:hypothetical protein